VLERFIYVVVGIGIALIAAALPFALRERRDLRAAAHLRNPRPLLDARLPAARPAAQMHRLRGGNSRLGSGMATDADESEPNYADWAERLN